MRKKVHVLLLLAILFSAASAQNTYKLKECDIAFKSPETFLAIYDNPGYAVYKNDFVEVTMSLIRFFDVNGMEKELERRFPEKEYTVYEQATLERNSNQKGAFSFANRKGYSSLFAKGLIMKDDKTVLVEIKFDARKENEVKNLVQSFFEGENVPLAKPTTPTQVADNDKQEPDFSPAPEPQPIKEEPKETPKPTPVPVVESKPAGPKHPPVSHPNLVKLTQAQRQEFVDAHNRWRADVGVAPLTWSTDLENYAAEWAVINGKQDCNMEHRTDHLYGENLYWSSGMAFSPKGAVDSWGSEIEDYHGEVVGQSNAVVGHYTQVVWRKTTEVGCAAFECGSALLVVCNYNPPGNYVGQHPYK